MGLAVLLSAGEHVGPYRVDGLLGRGAMGHVYLAWSAPLRRHVALKVLLPEVRDDPEARRRLKQEALTVSLLSHPSIVGIHDYSVSGDRAYLAVDLVDGGTLADLLTHPLPLREVVRLLAPVAAALDHAHSRGVLHRDVKPSNILLTRDGRPVLADFGLLKVAGSTTTEVGTVIGTPHYMAPEQAAGAPIDGRADVYALGVVAYQALTGVLPFDRESAIALLMAHVHDAPPPPRSIAPWLSVDVERALLAALSKAPDERPATAGEFIRLLATSGASAAGGWARLRAATRALAASTSAAALVLAFGLRLAGIT
jgi:serine/threonine protein kinase